MEQTTKRSFFHGLRQEFKQIIWPKKKDAAKKVLLVLVCVAIGSVCVAFLDHGIQQLVQWITTIGA